MAGVRLVMYTRVRTNTHMHANHNHRRVHAQEREKNSNLIFVSSYALVFPLFFTVTEGGGGLGGAFLHPSPLRTADPTPNM